MNLKQKCDQVMKDTGGANIHKHPLFRPLCKDFKEVSMPHLFPDDVPPMFKIHIYSTGEVAKCRECGHVHGRTDKPFCSKDCYLRYKTKNAKTPQQRRQYFLLRAIKEGERKFENASSGWDYLVCPICGCKTGGLANHIKYHDVSRSEFMKIYGYVSLKTGKEISRMKGSGNPGWKHGGRLSAWSENFIHGYDEERHEKFNETRRSELKDPNNRKHSPFFLEYWIEQCNGDLDKAKAAYSKSQTRDLDWFINKFGEDEGRRRHAEKHENGLKILRKVTFLRFPRSYFVK